MSTFSSMATAQILAVASRKFNRGRIYVLVIMKKKMRLIITIVSIIKSVSHL